MSEEDLKELCEGCALNGKQSWSKNPLLACMWHGGLYPAFHFVEGEEEDALLTSCDSYTPARNYPQEVTG